MTSAGYKPLIYVLSNLDINAYKATIRMMQIITPVNRYRVCFLHASTRNIKSKADGRVKMVEQHGMKYTWAVIVPLFALCISAKNIIVLDNEKLIPARTAIKKSIKSHLNQPNCFNKYKHNLKYNGTI